MELVLRHREVDDMVDPTLCPRRPEDPEELQKWVRKDKTARMTIGLTLSDEMLENVSHTTTLLICGWRYATYTNAHTLLNKLAARRDFYTATMKEGEKMLVYIKSRRKMASTLQSMDVR